MRDVEPLRYRDWVPYWAIAWLGGYLWASSGPDLTWRRVAAITLAAFGALMAGGVRHLLVRRIRPYRYAYSCPAGHLDVSSNDQKAMAAMRDAHRAKCEASRG